MRLALFAATALAAASPFMCCASDGAEPPAGGGGAPPAEKPPEDPANPAAETPKVDAAADAKTADAKPADAPPAKPAKGKSEKAPKAADERPAQGEAYVIWAAPGHEQFTPGAMVRTTEEMAEGLRASGKAREASPAEVAEFKKRPRPILDL